MSTKRQPQGSSAQSDLAARAAGDRPAGGQAAGDAETEAERRLRESEERYRALALATAQIVWTATPAGLVEDDLPLWRAYTGQSAAEVRGAGWLDAVHPDDRGPVMAAWAHALATRDRFEVEQRIRRHDGVYRTFAVRAVPVPDAGGGVREWVGGCTDIEDRKALERELTARVSELEAIFAALPDRLTIFDEQGRIVRLNPAARRAAGPSRGREGLAEFQQAYDLRTPDGAPIGAEGLPLTRALRGETVAGAELRYRGPDGRDELILATAAPLVDTAGRVRGAVAIAQDITALRAAERAAVERANELEAAFQAIADGVAVFDAAGRLVRVNRALAQLFGPDAEPGDGPEPMEALIARYAPRDRDGRPVLPEDWAQVRVLRGEMLVGADMMDGVVTTRDGHELELTTSGAPVREAAGRIVGAVLVVREMTERRRQARRRREALEALVEMAEALVSGQGTSGVHPLPTPGGSAIAPVARRLAELALRVLECRRVAINTIDPGTDLKRPVVVTGLSPEQERAWWARWEAPSHLTATLGPERVGRLRAGEVVAVDMTRPPFTTPAYGTRTAMLVPVLVEDELIGLLSLDYGEEQQEYANEEMALAVGVARLVGLVIERDRLLREREEARGNALALRQANQRMNEFLGVASHELRTPLTVLKTNVQMAQRTLRAASAVGGGATAAGNRAERLARAVAAAEGFLERADQGMKRMNRLVGDLLDVSRIQSGRLELRTEPVDLREIVRETVAEQQQAQPERVIRLAMPGRAVPVVADADRIGQVITNYLTNALRYSPEERPVEVRLEARDGTARVAVRDEGPGVPANEREHIWERFYRAPAIAVSAGSGIGLGLGLHISREIVERHHGAVGLESAPGRGATFWFSLPLATSEPE